MVCTCVHLTDGLMERKRFENLLPLMPIAVSPLAWPSSGHIHTTGSMCGMMHQGRWQVSVMEGSSAVGLWLMPHTGTGAHGVGGFAAAPSACCGAAQS